MKVRTHVLLRTAVAAGAVASLVTAPPHVEPKIATAGATMIASAPQRDNDLVLVHQLQQRASRDAFRARLAIEKRIQAHRRVVARARAIQAARDAQRARIRAQSILIAGDSVAWARTAEAVRVKQCESGGNPRAVNGKYMGAWQMDEDFWQTYGGLRFASTPLGATMAQQDYVAWRGWQHRGWQPWTCAG